MKNQNFENYTLEVLGLPVSVEFERGTTHDGDVVSGLFVFDKKSKRHRIKINIDECPTKKDVITVLIHELGHAALFRIGMHETNLDHNLEELIVDAIATVISENFDFEL